MAIIQTHFTSKLPQFPNSILSSGKNPTLKPNFAHFTRTKPPRLVIRAAGTDYYKTLNLHRNATLKEIKTSYRKLALQYHPDLNKDSGAEEKFKEITAAYEVLSDDEKRTAYDRSGDAGLQGDYGSWTTGSTGVTFQFHGTGESGGINVNVKSTGSQIYEIRFKEPIVIKVLFAEAFETCGGSGAESKSNVEACDACAGSGAESDNCIKSCTGSGGTGGLGAVIATAVTVSIILFLGLAAIIPGKRSCVVKMIAKQEMAYKSGTSANE